MNLQDAKRIVRAMQAAVDAAPAGASADALAAHVSQDYRWRGYHPFGDLRGSGPWRMLFGIRSRRRSPGCSGARTSFSRA